VTKLLAIDPSDAAPIWRQIEDGVRRMVISGALDPGAPVPSVRDLARELRVNPATVSKAYQRLTAAGVLEVRRGEGTFVAPRSAGVVDAERRALLEDEARRFAESAREMGSNLDGALQALRRAWRARGDDDAPGGDA
jgi:GntR family transcriptional regulator